MTPEEHVTVREFERTHAELREGIAEMKKENSDDHAMVVAALAELRNEVSAIGKGLGKVVTWPQLATLAIVAAAIAGVIVTVVK